jgi:hypothetical protein
MNLMDKIFDSMGTVRRVPLSLEVILVMLAAALMFVWSMPNLTGLRNSLLAIDLLICFPLAWSVLRNGGWRRFIPALPLKIYFLLTLWIVLCVILFADNRILSFHEIWGQWIRSALAGTLGLLLASLSASRRLRLSSAAVLTILMLAIFSQVLLHDVDMLWQLAKTGHFPFGETRILESKTVLSYVVNMVLAFSAAELMGRVLFKRRYMPLPGVFFVFVGLFCIFASYTLQARNGMIGTLALLVSCSLLFWFVKRKTTNNILLGSLALLIFSGIITLGWFAYKSDPRWKSLLQTVPVAWDTQGHQEWIHRKYPLLDDGTVADGSNYERIAWAKEALLQIAREPIGIGYNRNAFGVALKKIHPDLVETTHSHSGILDFTIANGIPGLIIFLALLWVCFQQGLLAFFNNYSPQGLLLAFIVSGFFGRSLVDSNIRDHMLEQFMFLLCIMLVFSLGRDSSES